MNVFSAGYVKRRREEFQNDPVYMHRFRETQRNTPPVRWYRVTGPKRFERKRLDGKTLTATSLGNDMLGQIVRPIPPTIGSICLSGVVFFEMLTRTGKTVRRERVGTGDKLELQAISK